MLHKVSWCASNEALFHFVDFSYKDALLPYSQTSDSEFQHGIVLFDFVAGGGGGMRVAWTCQIVRMKRK